MTAPTRKLDLLGLTDTEFAVPTETRVQRGLANPVEKSSAGTMQLGAINKISQARIRYALAELTNMALNESMEWLRELAKESPAAALDRLIELAKFNVAQQKSMTVEQAPTDNTNYGNLTMRQLQGLVFQQPDADGVVSDQ